MDDWFNKVKDTQDTTFSFFLFLHSLLPKLKFFLLLICIVGAELTTLFIPVLLGCFVDSFQSDKVAYLLFAFLGISILRLVFESLVSFLDKTLYLGLANKLRRAIIYRLHYSEYNNNSNKYGELHKRLYNEINAVSQMVIRFLPRFCSNIVSLIGIVFLLSRSGKSFAIAAFVGLFLQLLIAVLSYKHVKYANKSFLEQSGELSHILMQMLNNLHHSKMIGCEEWNSSLVLKSQNSWKQKSFKLHVKRKFQAILFELSRTVVAIGTFIVLFLLLNTSQISAGIIVSTFMLLTRIQGPTARLVSSLVDFFSQHPQFSRIFELLHYSCNNLKEISIPIDQHKNSLKRFKTIRLKQISIRYPQTNKTVLSGVNYVFEKGKSYAVFGKNGSGKSSFLKALLSTIPLESGKVLFDEKELSYEELVHFRQRSVLVPQEDVLWRASVNDNILLGDNKSNFEMMPYYITEFINKLSIRDVVDKDTISGGQARLISIARALIRLPSGLIILDEPERGLDSSINKLMWDTIFSYCSEACLIIVSHTPEILDRCDKVIYLSDGKIVSNN